MAASARVAEEDDGLLAFVGADAPPLESLRLLGLFAHPDDEVFCAGGTLARCAEAGAAATVVSLTRGEAGQIRDAAVASRRTLGAVRADELEQAGVALGLARTCCLDLGDGTLVHRPLADITAVVRDIVEDVGPDVVVTFGPDGAFGHPDHVTSCLATLEAVTAMARPPGCSTPASRPVANCSSTFSSSG